MARRQTRSLPQRPAVTGSLNLSIQRQKKGISLEQIAEATKISIRFLKAIEEEEFEKLPGGIFNTSYLKQYAAAIGLEESNLLAYYERLTNPEPAASGGEPGAERSLLDRWFRIPPAVQRS